MAEYPSTYLPVRTDPGGAFVSIYDNDASFEAAQRRAKSLAASTLIPPQFQQNMPNCLVALELASRLKMSPLIVVQNVDVIHGRPFMRATFVIAIIDGSKRFRKPLQFRFEGKVGTMDRTCTAWTVDRDGDKIEGMLVSMRMAKEEGWLDRKGSKWKTLPDLMLQYRAATFFGRLMCPDLLMGLRDEHEVIDIGPAEYQSVVERPAAPTKIAERLAARAPEPETDPWVGSTDTIEDEPDQTPVAVTVSQPEAVEVDDPPPPPPPPPALPFTKSDIQLMIGQATNLDQIPEIRDLIREFPASMRAELGAEIDKREASILRVRGTTFSEDDE